MSSTSVFSKIIAGELPGRFVWQDEVCVAFLTIQPITDGHCMVVPREEIVQWTDASPEVNAHLMDVAQKIAQAQQAEWEAPRVGLLCEGFLVPHLHVHTWPAFSMEDFDPHRVQNDVPDAKFEEVAERLRSRLRAMGHEANVTGPGPLA
ncbi:HIT family protein [Kribbia dieselivorans]|uniref:HIT family protein n=1 Tax=Kribbia dieselivorans TaxID=331526 RepID=UPI0008393ACA|nr:HIT family protein [Kribbia dieselivorans]